MKQVRRKEDSKKSKPKDLYGSKIMNKEAQLEETKKMMQEISEAHDNGLKRFEIMKKAIRYKDPNDRKPEIKTRFTDDSCLNI